jgi:DNA-binding transcriptional regulator YiaG
MDSKLGLLAKASPENVRGLAEQEARVRFIRARRALGLSQTAIAIELGCSVDSVELWERGKVRVPAWALVAAERKAA